MIRNLAICWLRYAQSYYLCLIIEVVALHLRLATAVKIWKFYRMDYLPAVSHPQGNLKFLEEFPWVPMKAHS